MKRILVTAVASAALILGGAQFAEAAPLNSGSAGSSSGSSGSAGPQRSYADQLFLRLSYYDEKSWDVQNSAIGLAHAQCQWLDTYGSSAANHIKLAERSRGTVDYPYIFLDAAIDAYCPHNAL
jgi:hypothetical protein